MAKLAQYEIECDTCGRVLTDWVQSSPTECPNGAAHTVDVGSVAVQRVADGPLVLKYIMGSAGSAEQLDRFIDALNAHPSFPYLINVQQYALAEAELDEAVTQGHITAADKTLAMQFVG